MTLRGITPENVERLVRAETERNVAFLDAFRRLRESTYQVPVYPVYPPPTRNAWWRWPTLWRVVHQPCAHHDCAHYRARYGS